MSEFRSCHALEDPAFEWTAAPGQAYWSECGTFVCSAVCILHFNSRVSVDHCVSLPWPTQPVVNIGFVSNASRMFSTVHCRRTSLLYQNLAQPWGTCRPVFRVLCLFKHDLTVTRDDPREHSSSSILPPICPWHFPHVPCSKCAYCFSLSLTLSIFIPS